MLRKMYEHRTMLLNQDPMYIISKKLLVLKEVKRRVLQLHFLEHVIFFSLNFQKIKKIQNLSLRLNFAIISKKALKI